MTIDFQDFFPLIFQVTKRGSVARRRSWLRKLRQLRPTTPTPGTTTPATTPTSSSTPWLTASTQPPQVCRRTQFRLCAFCKENLWFVLWSNQWTLLGAIVVLFRSFQQHTWRLWGSVKCSMSAQKARIYVIPKLGRYKDTIMCVVLGKGIPGLRQKPSDANLDCVFLKKLFYSDPFFA